MRSRIIYAVASQYQDDTNHTVASQPISGWFFDHDKAKTLCAEKNVPIEVELKGHNEAGDRKVARQNREYEVLVANGLREPREPLTNSHATRLYYSQPWVVVEDVLLEEETDED